MQNVMKGEGEQAIDATLAGAASIMVLSISQSLEVELPADLF